MRRWSLKDYYVEGFHEFPGTVHWTSATRLKNDTGQRFSQGLFLDFKANKTYSLAALGPGEEFDLAGIVPRNLRSKSSPPVTFTQMGRNIRPAGEKNWPFSLEEVPYMLPSYLPSRVFAGVIEAAGVNAGLDAAGTTRQNLAVAIVALDQP